MISVSPIYIIILYAASFVAIIVSQRSVDSKKPTTSQKLSSQEQSQKKYFTLIFWLSLLLGITCHFLHAASISYVQHSFNFSVTSMSLWFSALIVCTFAIGSCIYPIKNLSIIVLPIAIACILFAHVWGDQPQFIDHRNSTFYWHIATAVSAFTLLSLSVLQALLFGYQELSLRKKHKNTITSWLPPIQTMEMVLFKSVFLGFIFLSISISLGSIYNYELNQTMLNLNHHTVLAILSWLGFAILLYGRIKLGWRGLKAINWTLIGFALLGLGYFGTKIIGELVNK